jgi:putative exosortase-associated protein (TIGR04073 family)
MRIVIAAVNLMLLIMCAVPAAAQEEQKPEAIVEKMTFKLVRGITNMATSVAELPKQSYLTVRDRGAIGYAVGPIKGFGMTLYRGFVGMVDTVFFLVPQPGYYDPLIDPVYVWQGWEERRIEPVRSDEPETAAAVPGGKSE